MPILNRLILVLQLILATGVSCRCGLELLLEPTGCNLVVCGDLEKAEADDCCPDEATYTPIFVASRITGWCAHIMEQHQHNRIIRPLAHYTGAELRNWTD